jgi:hypothetical protein
MKIVQSTLAINALREMRAMNSDFRYSVIKTEQMIIETHEAIRRIDQMLLDMGVK